MTLSETAEFGLHLNLNMQICRPFLQLGAITPLGEPLYLEEKGERVKGIEP